MRNEFVLQAEGEIVVRQPETVNEAMPTGEVELQVDRLRIVSRSTPLPFSSTRRASTRRSMRYRWLDLRREKLQRNLGLRAQMVGIIRRHMEEAGYLDIQTPIHLFKPTPEGARDFIVPSRLHIAAVSSRSHRAPRS